MSKLPQTSMAVVLREYGTPVEVEEVEVADLEPGAVLMKVDCATVCGTDVHIQHGRLPASKLPLILGHESTGTIVGINSRDRDSNDEPLQVGDQIVFSYPWCGVCYWCSIARQPTLCENAQMYGWGPCDRPPFLTGAFAEYVYIRPECHIVRVPPRLDPRTVASSTCALRSVMHGFDRLASVGPLLPSDTVVILGSGAVGLYATAVAIASGVEQVLLLGAPDERLRAGTAFGAREVVNIENTTESHRKQLILEATNGRGADIVIDCAGPPAAFKEALELVRRGGRVLEIGIGGTDAVPIHPYYFNIRMITVIGSLSGDIRHYYRALRFIEHHQSSFDFSMLTQRDFGLYEVNAALRSVENQDLIKPAIIP